jgi:sarcosine oxidase
MQLYDAIVLGAGGVGSAAMFHLARRGLRVIGLDRFSAAHDRGSSHGETRVIRQAYFEHPDYVPLLLKAYARWAELESITGHNLLQQVGLLQVGPAHGAVVSGVLASARQHQLQVEQLTATETERRFPGVRVPEGMCAAFEPRAGFLRVEKCVLGHLLAAMQCGAELRTGVAVQSWRAQGDGVEVLTDRGTFSAGRLIVAAGAWAGPLLADLRLPLRVLRKHVYWFENRETNYRQEAGFPTYLFELPTGVYYGFPQIDPQGLKMGEHTGGETVADPLTDPRTADDADLARVATFRSACLPGVGSAVLRRSVCFYTMSPDEHFYLDRHPQHPQVAFAAGLSGHGFKFTSVLGEALADLATAGATSLPVGFLGLR